jgi:hypothetical protein
MNSVVPNSCTIGGITLNLADMLCYADIHQLNKIAQHYRCECSVNSKNELIQAILNAINRNESFNKFISDMTIEDIRFLNSMLFESRALYSLEDLTARASQARFAPAVGGGDLSREMISAFKQKGWIFNGYSHETKYVFQVPDDLRERTCDALQGRFQSNLDRVDEPPAYRDEQHVIADDIMYLLRYIAQEDVPLTTDGAIYKRVLIQLLDGMTVKEQPLSRGGWRFGYGRRFREYPDRFSFIYDYCYYNELLREQDDQLQLTDKGQKLVIANHKEDLGQIFRLWIRLYKGPIRNVLALTHWVQRLSSRWVTASSLIQCLGPMVKPFYYDNAETIVEQRILQMMMHLGLIRIGENVNGKVVQATQIALSVIRGVKVSDEEVITFQK